MDRIIAARVYGVREPEPPEERVKCDLCGLPYVLDRLTAVSEDQLICPECYEIYAASVRRHRARKQRMKNRLEVIDCDTVRFV